MNKETDFIRQGPKRIRFFCEIGRYARNVSENNISVDNFPLESRLNHEKEDPDSCNYIISVDRV